MPVIFPLPNNPRVRTAESFEALVSTPFANGVNALCWPRTLPFDFDEIVAQLGPGEGVRPLDGATLNGLKLSPTAQTAREFLLNDLHLLRAHALAPELNCIHDYPRDEPDAVVPTDVYDFHVDSAPVESATWLCTYHGAPSEALPNEQARRYVDDPAIRAKLLREYGGTVDDGFREFLAERHYDLHYAPLPGAVPVSFGIGHLWRIAVEWPDSPVPPCIHRAPLTLPGDPPRLLLIS